MSQILTVHHAQYKNWCHTIRSLPLTKQKSRFSLPPELLLEVLSYLSDSQTSLYAASLVCQEWLYCTAPILYCHPKISDTYRWATFILTLTRERMTFFYGDLVRSIDLSSGKSIEAMKDQEFYRRLSDTPIHAEPSQTHPRSITITINRNHLRFEDSQAEQEQEFIVKGLPFITVSTSSLIQISNACKNITCLNLSYTSLLHDSQVAETGEYLSTLQHFVQPGLTHIQIPIEHAIQAIGRECQQLTQVKVQRCEWVTAHVIWMFVYYCPHLKLLDARRSTKCTVKRLIATVLETSRTIPITSNTWRRRNQDISSSIISTHRMYSNYHHHVHYNLNRNQENQRRMEEEEAEVDTEEGHEDETTFTRLQEESYERFEDSFIDSGHRSAEKSLKNIVYDILVDAKELGVIDLNWLQDY